MSKDYYISFHEKDEGWASWLAWHLEEHGHSVHFEGWGGRLHGDQILGLQRALAQTRNVLLVLSPDYLASDHTQRELSASLALSPERLLPVEVRPSQVQELWPQVRPVHLSGTSAAEAKELLQIALRSVPLRPQQEPPYPGAPRSVPEEPAFPGPKQPMAVPLSPLAEGTVLDGKWRIERPLGKGGMGEVWLARHHRLSKWVAVKVLHANHAKDPRSAKRFFQEAEAVAKMRLPGLVDVLDHGQLPSGQAYLIMEYLEGESLGQRLRRQSGGLGRAGLVLIRQLAEILDTVHSRSVVHRDLKPDNLMIVPDPGVASLERPKILDFGIARVALSAEEGSTAGTQANVPMGTPPYMAPEQFQDAASVGAKADVYSLGIILFQVVTGRLPFAAQTFAEWVHRHCQVPAPRLLGVAPELAALCAQMLEKSPAARPSAGEVARRLASQLESQQAPNPKPSTRRILLGAASAVLLALALSFALQKLKITPAAEVQKPAAKQDLQTQPQSSSIRELPEPTQVGGSQAKSSIREIPDP